jgi:hypothetical protein
MMRVFTFLKLVENLEYAESFRSGRLHMNTVRMTVRALRAAAGKTQTEVAAAVRIDQADVLRLERKQDFDDCEVATLRRYIESLDGKLEVVAVFGNKKITLAGVEPTRG